MFKNALFTILSLGLIVNCFGQERETKQDRKNYIFIEPTYVLGDLFFDLNNIWLVLGYQRRLNDKNYLDSRFGFIVKSYETPGSLVSPLNQLQSKGNLISIGHKYLMKDKLFYMTTLFIQHTRTIREESIEYAPGEWTRSPYSVNRFVAGLTPNLGRHFVGPKHVFCDISFGIDIRYISSSSLGKKEVNNNLDREFVSKKIYDDGSLIAPNFPIQFKIGYNF